MARLNATWQQIKHDTRGITLVSGLIYLLMIGVGTPAVITGVSEYDAYQERQSALEHQVSDADRESLRDSLQNMVRRYPAADYCFSRIASLGNQRVFLEAFDKTPVVQVPSDPLSVPARYENGVIYLADSVEHLSTADLPLLELTIWHEVTHIAEIDNGDRWNWRVMGDDNTWTARSERHTEYMEMAAGIMSGLAEIEDGVRSGNYDTTRLRGLWRTAQQRAVNGSANEFEPIPDDLDELGEYSGFSFPFDEIEDMYRNGSCIDIPSSILDGVEEEPEGESENVPLLNAELEDSSDDPYIVWDGTNANVGINITKRSTFEADELARDYDGGGIDPEKILEKNQIINQDFSSYDAAETAVCADFTNVHAAPLFDGLVGDYKGEEFTIIGNFDCEPNVNDYISY